MCACVCACVRACVFLCLSIFRFGFDSNICLAAGDVGSLPCPYRDKRVGTARSLELVLLAVECTEMLIADDGAGL